MNGLLRGLLTVSVMVVSLGLFVGNVSAQTGAIEGTVSDAVTGLPIEGALVMVRAEFEAVRGSGYGGPGPGGHVVLTDASGHYVLEGLFEGQYRLKSGARGYLRTDVQVVVIEDQTTVLDIALEPMTFGSVEGQVTDAVSGQPISGAHVILWPAHETNTEGDGHWLRAMTDINGMYVIENVLAGDYEARAMAFGYLTNEPVFLIVNDGATTTVDLALDPLAFGSVEGTVTDAATGSPIEGARVSLIRSWTGGGTGNTDGHWHHAMTDENGFYSFDDVEVATYQVVVSARGYVGAESEVEIFEGQTSTADFALDALVFGSVEGTVTDAQNGDPIGRALVMILPGWTEGFGGHGGWWMARTDENGFYRFDEVPVGSFRMLVFARTFVRAETEVEVLEGQTTTVDFALEQHSIPARRVR